MKVARSIPHYKDKVKLRVDKLSIDGKLYKAENIMDLPEPINPVKLATKSDGQMVKFFGKASPLSNFHPCKMKIEGVTYSCNEQRYQWAKAHEFGDEVAAARIMATTDPFKMYVTGQNIQKFDETRWRQVCDERMLEGLMAKFQNPKMKHFLLQTGQAYIAECNGKDAYWGTGLYMDKMTGMKTDALPGQNKLGCLLMRVREQLQV